MEIQPFFIFSFKKNTPFSLGIETTKENKSQQISYRIEIIKAAKKSKGLAVFTIKRNLERHSYPLNYPYIEALIQSNSLWSNLKLALTNEGKIQHILNLKEIQTYWHTILKPQLQSTYEGLSITRIILQLDTLVKQEQKLINQLQEDLFFHVWLRIISGEYQYHPLLKKLFKINGYRDTEVHYTYKIEQQTKPHFFLKGRGKKSSDTLLKLQKIGQLADDSKLIHQEQFQAELNESHEITQLQWKETYRDAKKNYCASQLTVSRT
ncbi:hypothetical protein [Myroides odoratus]|uniref:hypothetical protein n=1 Tax=Myroides odoratus TaxID=256 RepID=UPI0039B12684